MSVWHGALDRAQEILAGHPEVSSSDIHTAAMLGDHEAVGRFLAADTANATAKGGPHNWDALTHLCFSKFLRLEPARSEGFLKAAAALLNARTPASSKRITSPSPSGSARSTVRQAPLIIPN